MARSRVRQPGAVCLPKPVPSDLALQPTPGSAVGGVRLQVRERKLLLRLVWI